VQVLSSPAGQPQDVTVTVGAANDSQTQILTGLKGTEAVVTQTVTPNSAGGASTRSGISVLGGGGARAGGGGGFRGGPGQ
jgi:hypothetical protein